MDRNNKKGEKSVSMHWHAFERSYKCQIVNDTKSNIIHNTSWPQIPDHPYRILTAGGSGSTKTNSLFNLISHQPDTYEVVYLYAKDPHEAKYQFLIIKRESTGFKHLNDPKGFIEYSNKIDDIYKNV